MHDYTIVHFFFFLNIVFLGHASCVLKTATIGDQSQLSYQRQNEVTWPFLPD